MTFNRVKKIIAEQLGVSDMKSITLSTSLSDDLDADSLDAVEIIMAIEDEFDLEIPDEEAEGLRTIKDIVEYIENKK